MQVTLPYVGHLDDCSKCGGNAHKVSYRAPESDGFEQEHLLYTCETCGYEHRRLTRHNTPPDPHPDDFMLITIEVDLGQGQSRLQGADASRWMRADAIFPAGRSEHC